MKDRFLSWWWSLKYRPIVTAWQWHRGAFGTYLQHQDYCVKVGQWNITIYPQTHCRAYSCADTYSTGWRWRSNCRQNKEWSTITSDCQSCGTPFHLLQVCEHNDLIPGGCLFDELECADKHRCIYKNHYCDGEPDCFDASDEGEYVVSVPVSLF